MKKKKKNKVVEPNILSEKEERNGKIIGIQKNNDVILMLLDGKETEEISKFLSQKYGIKESTAIVNVSQARKQLRERAGLEVHNVINIHLNRYEHIYAELRKIKAQAAAMDALRAKERLLQFHREGFHMKVTQGEIQTMSTNFVNKEFDIAGKLTQEDKERLSGLLVKAKRGGNEETVQRTIEGVS